MQAEQPGQVSSRIAMTVAGRDRDREDTADSPMCLASFAFAATAETESTHSAEAERVSGLSGVLTSSGV